MLTIVGDDQDRAYPIHRAQVQSPFEPTSPFSSMPADDPLAGNVSTLGRVLATVPPTLATVVVLLQQRVVRIYAHGNPAKNSADYMQVVVNLHERSWGHTPSYAKCNFMQSAISWCLCVCVCVCDGVCV
jgi:hypothetical protein